MAEQADRRAWIALSSVDGVGEQLFGRLLADFGTARDVIARAAGGGLAEWAGRQRQLVGRPVARRETLAEIAALAQDGDDRLARLDELGLWTLTPLDADFPSRLRDLDPPPMVIHGRGDSSLLHAERSVAVVGTRRPTPAGRLLAARVAGRLVEARAVVVSGVAVGIDGVAHSATLDAGGRTIGVIGGGHLHPGPRAHARLRERICEQSGALISEHYPTIRPTHGTYPRRNRLIAALGEATLVIEAPATSGALITARVALELGRLVLVAPGRVGDWSMAGALRLLRDGPARPLVGLDEMLEDLGYLSAGSDAPAPGEGRAGISATAALDMLDGPQRAVAERLRRAPAGLDVLVDDLGLPPPVVASAVTLLLVRGWVQPVGPAYLPAGPLLASP